MKIKLNYENGEYLSVRKRQTDGQSKIQYRIKTSGDEKLKINNEPLELSDIAKSHGKLHPLQLPSQRYFKRVFNKDISPTKFKVVSSTSRTAAQQKQFTRSSNNRPQQNLIEQKQNDSSTYNFSLGLFNKSSAMKSSFFESSDPPVRNSSERKLDFSKIFIQAQEQSFRSVIQLSVRELQNKDMLDKAVQQLNKRKLQKKIKVLKKNMGLNSPKSRRKVDQAIEMLRNESIGYKTFYNKQISIPRCHTQSEDKSLLNNTKNHFETPQKVLNSLELQSNELKFNINSFNPEEIFQQSSIKNNIIIQDQEPQQTKKKQQARSDSSSQQKNQPIQDEFRKTDEKFKIQMDSKGIIIHHSNPNNIKLPSLTARNSRQHNQASALPQISSQNLKKSKKIIPKSSSNSLQRLSTIIKSSQNQTIQINRNRAHTRILESIQDPFESKQHEQNPTINQVSSPNDEFPFLMTKQDLQTTLNKSRYQMKKLLCMHIQRRQKQWKEVKRKLLLQEDNLEAIQQENYGKNKTKKKNHVLPPEHLLKIQTKQLKKSVRSFVSLLHSTKNLSSDQKVRVKSELK